MTIKSRATDDSGNIETPGPGVNVTVNCPCSLFGSNYTPSITSANDPSAYELGMKFQSTRSRAGWPACASTRARATTGRIPARSGRPPAPCSLPAPSRTRRASGWQTMTFANPVQISANTTYVVSYYDPAGPLRLRSGLVRLAAQYAAAHGAEGDYMATGGGNGVFNTGGPGFPTSTFSGSSYARRRDLRHDPAGQPPAVTVSRRPRVVRGSGVGRADGDVLRSR